MTLADLRHPLNFGVVHDCAGDGLDPGDVLQPVDGPPDCHGFSNGVDDDGLLLSLADGPVLTIDDIFGADFSLVDGVNSTAFGANGVDSFDWHGTSVASIAGATGDNGQGIAGISWRTRILPIRISRTGTEADLFSITYALTYANARGANIANMSFGLDANYAAAHIAANAVHAWEALFDTYSSPAMVHVAAAGNSGQDCDTDTWICLPAELNSPIDVIGVAGSDRLDAKAKGSNFGKTTIEIAAPGIEVVALGGNPGSLLLVNGTSVAAPQVAGAAALMLERHDFLRQRSAASAEAIRCRLLLGADVVPTLAGRIEANRRLNVFRALQAQSSVCP